MVRRALLEADCSASAGRSLHVARPHRDARACPHPRRAHPSDSTPARGSLVKFSGSASSAHDGRSAYIQRRSSTGRFVTVGRTTLRDAGDAKWTYSARVRVSRDAVYRVKVLGDGDHINGFSRMRALAVHG